MSYIYTEQNRLDFPHTYQYTPFQGKHFVTEYLQARKKYCKHILKKTANIFFSPEKRAENPSLNLFYAWILNDDVLNPVLLKSMEIRDLFRFFTGDAIITSDAKNILSDFKDKKFLDTREMLNRAAGVLIEGKDLLPLYVVLGFYIKKYEVTKKLYTAYRKDRKSGSENFRDSSVYNMLSFCLLMYYDRVPNLKFLNCALKINDTVCSLNEFDHVHVSNLLLNLYMEHKAVIQLVEKKEIAL